ncbi:hypothetical protein AB6A40_011246, partial [Gnathostoma spinigerum]
SWSIKYADLSTASGLYGIDTISLADNSTETLKIRNQYFGMADTWSEFGMAHDGILALSSPYTNESSNRLIFANAVEQNLVEKPMFTIWFDMKVSILLKNDSNANAQYFLFHRSDNVFSSPLS